MDDTKHFEEDFFLNDNSCNTDGVEYTPTPRKKRKRGQRGPAIRYTEEQLTLLKSVYNETSYPSKAHVQYLTRRTQLPATIIRRWFYQKRCREGLCGSLERIHLIPQSVPQADVSSHEPNYKRFKTVLVQIQSPTRSSESTPRSSSTYSPSVTGDFFRHQGSCLQQTPEQTPSKVNLVNVISTQSFPYENTDFDAGQLSSRSTPKSEIGVSDSGFISHVDDSLECHTSLTYDEPISSVNFVNGYYQPLELNDLSNSAVCKRDIIYENQSDNRANRSTLQENDNGISYFRRSDISEIDQKALNSDCSFNTKSPFKSGAFEVRNFFHNSESEVCLSTEEHSTTQPGRYHPDSKAITSKPQQTITKDSVTIQYINSKDFKKLGIGSNINLNDIPTLKTGEPGPDLQQQSRIEKDIDSPCKASRGSPSKRKYIIKPIEELNQIEFKTCTTYKSTYTQTNPEDPYLSELPQGCNNTSDFNPVTTQASRNIRDRIPEDVFYAYGDQHDDEGVFSTLGVKLEGKMMKQSFGEVSRSLGIMQHKQTGSLHSSSIQNSLNQSDVVNPVRRLLHGSQANSGRVTPECVKDIKTASQPKIAAQTQNWSQSLAQNTVTYKHPGKNVLETKRAENPYLRQTKYSTCSRSSDGRSSDLQQNHFKDASTGTIVKETAGYQNACDKAIGACYVTYDKKPRSSSVLVVHPPRNLKYQTMDGKSHRYREASLRINRQLESDIYTQTLNSRESMKPNTLPSYSQSCGDDLNGILGHPAACDINNMDFAHSNTAEEIANCPPSPELSHPSNSEDFNDITPSVTLHPKLSKPRNIIKVIRVKKFPGESNEKQKSVSEDGLETVTLNPALNSKSNCSINPNKCAMDDSKICECSCHCCCCRSSGHAHQVPGLPQIYILPIHISDLGEAPSGSNVDKANN